MPYVATAVSDLLARLDGTARIDGGSLVVVDAARFRGEGIRDLAWTAAFSSDEGAVEAARWIVREASQALGARSASIQELYAARGRGEVSGFTVPAINIRAQTFDMARIVFETAAAKDVGAVSLELARSEQTYTYQRPIDYSTAVLAGAIGVKKVSYSVPALLIGQEVRVEVYEGQLKIFHGRELLLRLDRARGNRRAVIDYRHLITHLLRKPGRLRALRAPGGVVSGSHLPLGL